MRCQPDQKSQASLPKTYPKSSPHAKCFMSGWTFNQLQHWPAQAAHDRNAVPHQRLLGWGMFGAVGGGSDLLIDSQMFRPEQMVDRSAACSQDMYHAKAAVEARHA